MSDIAISLQGRLGRLGVDALLFNTSEILPSINLKYLTGFNGSDASAFITRSERHLYTDGRYKTQVKQQAPDFQTHVVRKKLDALARAIKKAGVNRLGIESGRMTHEFARALGKRVPKVEIIGLSRNFLEGLRIRKGEQEKAKIRKAADIASRSCEQLLAGRPLAGRIESDVAEDLEALFRRNGAEGIAFETIVASGDRSALPHGMASDRKIGKGELIVIDYGCRLNDYNSDETVTCVIGRPSSEQKKMYQAVRDAHDRAMESLKEGVRTKEVDKIARESIDKAGFGKYFLHGLGHGLGLEVHEPPYLSPLGRGVISAGMVFTIEPGVYVEGLGGVRLESLVYMDRNGPEILSGMPKDLIQIS